MTDNKQKTIDFYEALRLMENAQKPFSVTWCKHSIQTKKGGGLHTENNVMFEGKRQTEDYELIFFKKTDGGTVSCHLYSLMFFNDLKMEIK